MFLTSLVINIFHLDLTCFSFVKHIPITSPIGSVVVAFQWGWEAMGILVTLYSGSLVLGW